jgi:phage/plasmid-like protein (TIGR03299 family)
MSHEVETAAIFGGAWHDAGTRVDHFMSVPEALEEAGLANWAMAKRPLYDLNEVTGQFEIAPDIFVHKRMKDGKRMGYVGNDYETLHNETLADIFALLVDKDGLNVAKMQTAGSLRDGKRVWMLMSLPDSGFTVGNNKHPIIPFLLGTNAHDGTSAGRFLPTTVDVVCMNTLNAALGQAYADIAVTIRHSGNMQEKIVAVQKMLAEAATVFGDFKVKADSLDDVGVSKDAYEEFVDFLFPEIDITKQGKKAINNRNAQVLALTEALKQEVLLLPQYTLSSRATGGFSYWQLLSAVTRFTTHTVPVRKTQGREENEVRFERQLLGAGAEFNAKATNKILEMAGVKG